MVFLRGDSGARNSKPRGRGRGVRFRSVNLVRWQASAAMFARRVAVRPMRGAVATADGTLDVIRIAFVLRVMHRGVVVRCAHTSVFFG
jgi:hypothetical protein